MMNAGRFLGFILAVTGILLGLSRLVLTGAVVGEAKSSLISVFGAILTIAGLLLVLASKNQ